MEIADQLLPFTKAQSALSFLLRPEVPESAVFKQVCGQKQTLVKRASLP